MQLYKTGTLIVNSTYGLLLLGAIGFIARFFIFYLFFMMVIPDDFFVPWTVVYFFSPHFELSVILALIVPSLYARWRNRAR